MSIDTDQTALDRWLAAGTWVEFAPGVECCKFYRSGQHEYQSHRRAMCPPADWEADQKCETCNGRGDWEYVNSVRAERCPDCGGIGLRRHPVTVPCHHRRSTGRSGYLTCSDCKAVSEPGTGYKWRPFPGRITVAWATVEWGPLAVVPDAKRIPATDCLILRSDGKQVLRWEKNRGVQRITLPPDVDPASLIGQWARGGTIERTP